MLRPALIALIVCATPALAASPPSGPGKATPRGLDGPAETTAWMSTPIAEEMARTLRKAGRAMTAIECRANLNLDADSGEGTELRFTSVANDGRIEWTWREFPAADFRTADRKLANEGFVLVGRQDFDRVPSGQPRSCALWHK